MIPESEIIEHYLKSGKVLDTWWKYKQHFSRYQITDILKKNNVLKKKGGAHNVSKELIADDSNNFRHLTDSDLNFEEEILTKRIK